MLFEMCSAAVICILLMSYQPRDKKLVSSKNSRKRIAGGAPLDATLKVLDVSLGFVLRFGDVSWHLTYLV